MPYKTWVAGEEVLAGDFNTYVQEQVVMTFPNAAGRTAALPSPKAGMLSYLLDSELLEQYRGGAWRSPQTTNYPRGLVVAQKLVPAGAVVAAGAYGVITGSDMTLPAVNRTYAVHANAAVIAFAPGDAEIYFESPSVAAGPAQRFSSANGQRMPIALTWAYQPTSVPMLSVRLVIHGIAGTVQYESGSVFAQDIGPITPTSRPGVEQEPELEHHSEAEEA